MRQSAAPPISVIYVMVSVYTDITAPAAAAAAAMSVTIAEASYIPKQLFIHEIQRYTRLMSDVRKLNCRRGRTRCAHVGFELHGFPGITIICSTTSTSTVRFPVRLVPTFCSFSFSKIVRLKRCILNVSRKLKLHLLKQSYPDIILF